MPPLWKTENDRTEGTQKGKICERGPGGLSSVGQVTTGPRSYGWDGLLWFAEYGRTNGAAIQPFSSRRLFTERLADVLLVGVEALQVVADLLLQALAGPQQLPGHIVMPAGP